MTPDAAAVIDGFQWVIAGLLVMCWIGFAAARLLPERPPITDDDVRNAGLRKPDAD